MKIYGIFILLASALFILHGCSQLEDNLTTGPDKTTECTICHGSGDHANPPKALNGDTASTTLGVGAHMTHLYFNQYSEFVGCGECHIPVKSLYDSTHIDGDGIAEITFGPLAKKTIGGSDTANPVWNRTTATCSNVYCHGQFKGGNLNSVFEWKVPGRVVCGSCHGNPQTGNPSPSNAPHNVNNWTRTDCFTCHYAVIDSTGTIIAPDKHINGVVNFGE